MGVTNDAWEGLVDLGLKVEAAVIWPGPMTPAGARQQSPFTAPFSTTVTELERELRMLSARGSVLQIGIRPGDLRNDGFPKVRAVALHPGVVLSFDASLVGGRRYLTYPADRFTTWQDNLRALALGLEALRKVRRYGIASADQQYSGYTALAQASSQSPGEARQVLLEFAGLDETRKGLTVKQLFRAAAKRAQQAEDSEGAMNAVLNAGRTLGAVT